MDEVRLRKKERKKERKKTKADKFRTSVNIVRKCHVNIYTCIANNGRH